MAASAFEQGASIEIDAKAFTLLRKVTESLWQLEEARTRRIHEYMHEELQRLYAKGKLIFLNSSAVFDEKSDKRTGKTHREISDQQFDAAKIRRSYVTSILNLPSTRSLIQPIIRAQWEKLKWPETPPHSATVLRWKAKYQSGGRDITVLAEAVDRKGNKKSRYPPEVIEIAEHAVDQIYLTRERKTIQDTLDRAAVRVIRENKLRPESDQLPAPTRRLIQRLIDMIPAFDKCVARYGQTAAANKFRSVLGHRTTSIPLERAEIDHTPMDIFVVDDDTWMPLGRPYLTSCIDDFTRCILGIHLGFDPPSYLSVARCLKDAFLPKVGLKEKYPEMVNNWLAHGVMQELTVDNGAEFHSKSLEKACYTLGIEIHYAPRKTGWFKGKIERWQGTVNRAISHGTPGTTFANIFDKGDYDPSKHAVVTLSTLQKIVRLWIVDYYHQKPHRTLKVPPAELWSSSIRPEDILVPDDPARLDAILGRIEERKLTHKGIELDGLLYNSFELAELRKRLGDKLDVEVRVNDADIGTIFVLSPDKKQVFEVDALRREYAKGTSRWQHRIYKRFAAKKMHAYDPASWLEAKETIVRLIREELLGKPKKSRAKLARFTQGKAGTVVNQTPVVDDSVKPDPQADLVPEQNSENESRRASLGKSDIPKKQFKPVYRERAPHHVQNERSNEA